MVPATSDWNFTPSSTALPSPLIAAGVAEVPNRLQGQVWPPTATVTPAEGLSTLPLSSVARDLIVTWPAPDARQVYDQLPRPVAGCQLAPPSVDTSTPPTTPPPWSPAVPVIVTLVPTGIE